MAEFEKQHYVQKALLNNFAIKMSNGKHKICLLDLFAFLAEFRNTESAFYEKNIYNVKKEDTKELEKKLKEKIEDPAIALIKKIIISKNEVRLLRKDISLLKKYLLIQVYRNPRNMDSYANPKAGIKQMSDYNINEDESKLDFWKREISAILDNDWDHLVNNIDLVSVRKHAIGIHTGFLMFLSTDYEFVTNDSGVVTERVPIEIPKEKEKSFIEGANRLSELFGADKKDFSEQIKKEIENKTSYIDNFILFPISSNFALLSVNSIWKSYIENPAMVVGFGFKPISMILSKYLSLPQCTFVNKDKITDQSLLQKFKDDNDSYIYKVHDIESEDTIYCNILLMNEALRHIGFKTPASIIPSIKRYNQLANGGLKKMRNNYAGFVDVLEKLQIPNT